MHFSEKKQRATLHRMRSTLAAIPNSCKTISHNILLIGLFSTLIGGVQNTWAACTPGSPSDDQTVTCTGVPGLPLFLNTFASAANNLTVNVNAGTQMNATLGGIALNLIGNNTTLNNSGLIDPASLGFVTVLSGGVVIGNTASSTVNVTNAAAGIIRGTGDLLGPNLTSLDGLALNIQNGTPGISNITNNGTINSSYLLNLTGLPSDVPVVAVYQGSQVNFINNGIITGRVAFETSAAGNTFTNSGAISGSVALGASDANTFTAITGSTVSAGGSTAPALGGLIGVNLTFAPTGQVDAGAGGTNTLVLQNTVGVGGGTAGIGTAGSGTYVNFSNLIVNSGTWTLEGPLVTGSSTLNGGIAQFNDNSTLVLAY